MRRAGVSIGVVGFVVGLALPSEADAAERVRGRYVRVDPPATALAVQEMEPQGTGGHILFINRCPGGLTINYGEADDSRSNTSMIVNGTIHLNEFPFSDASWNQIVSDVVEMMAPFGIVVTDVDPGNVPHDEALVCGSYQAAGFEEAAGIAPYTCGQIPNVITFTFPETIGDDTRYTSETVAQEAAHGWGLDHSFKCEDPMTYLLDCGDKAFQDGDYPCGEYEARACDCGGATQNTYQHIMGLFGAGVPDTSAPAAQIVAPLDGDEFDAGADFDIAIDVNDDIDVTRVTLYVDGEQQGFDDTPPFDGWPVSGIERGEYSFRIEAQDAAGNVGDSNVVTVYVGMNGPGNGAGDDGEGDGGGNDGGDDEDEDSDDESGGGGGIDPGVFPTSARPEAGGCACRSSNEGSTWSGLLVLVLAGGLRRRRRA
jgi:MYXO-CTERM domain-containing protein